MASGKADGSIIINTKILEGGFQKGMSAMKSGLGTLGKTADKTMSGVGRSIDNAMDKAAQKVQQVGKLLVSAFALTGLVKFAEECIQLGSDLTEMENVTSTVFPNMTKEINEWSDAALNNYGLTRIMAKNYVGTFGAMAKAFGFTEKQAFDMSTELAGLAGDVSSFYNLSQDEAFGKLKSIFTGESEALKSLGVVMTQAALDQYALQNGFGKTTAQMTEAEKVTLRMAFVTDKLNAASGDFIKTQDSWANQTKRLSASFTELKTTIGQGLINLFTPIIKGLNTLMSYLHTAARAFSTFAATLMGKKAGGGSGGGGSGAAASVAEASESASDAISSIADTAAKAANSTADAADATEDYAAAEKAAKKAATGYLSAMDEVNRFTSEQADDSGSNTPKSKSGGSPSSGSSPSGSGASSIPSQLEQIYDDSAFAVDDIAEEFSEFGDRLRRAFESGDWAGLGQALGEKINEVMAIIKEKISWDNVGPQITYFITAFTTTFNSLIDTVDWDLVGSTVGEGVNTVLESANLLLTGIDWELIGTSLSDGVNGLIKTVKWKTLGSVIAGRFNATIGFFSGFVSGLSWSGLGDSIAQGINGVIENIQFTEFMDACTIMLNGMWKAIIWASAGIQWRNAANIISAGVNSGVEKIDTGLMSEAITTFLGHLLDAIVRLGEGIHWEDIGTNIRSGINRFFIDFEPEKLTTVLNVWANGILTAVTKAVSGIQWKEAFTKVKDGILELDFSGIGANAIGLLWEGLNNDGMAEKDKEAVKTSLGNLEGALDKIINFSFDAFKDFYDNYLVKVADWVLVEGLSNLADIVANVLGGVDWDSLNTGLANLWDVLDDFSKGIGEGFLEFINGLSMFTGTMIKGLSSGLGSLLNTIDGKDGDVIEAVGKGIGNFLGFLVAAKLTATIVTNIGNLVGYLPGLIGAFTGNPIAIAGVAGAIGLAIYNVVSEAGKPKVAESIKTIAESITTLKTTLSEDTIKEEGNYAHIKEILDKYIDLNNKLASGDNLTKDEEAMLETYRTTLEQKVPGIVEKIGEIGAAYINTRGDLYALIDAQRDQAILEILNRKWAEASSIVVDQEVDIRLRDRETAKEIKGAIEGYINDYYDGSLELFNKKLEELATLNGEEFVAFEFNDKDIENYLLLMQGASEESLELTDTWSAFLDAMYVAEWEKGSANWNQYVTNYEAAVANIAEANESLADVESAMAEVWENLREGPADVYYSYEDAKKANDSIADWLTETAKAIDEAGGLWVNGVQMAGDETNKAIRAFDTIMSKLGGEWDGSEIQLGDYTYALGNALGKAAEEVTETVAYTSDSAISLMVDKYADKWGYNFKNGGMETLDQMAAGMKEGFNKLEGTMDEAGEVVGGRMAGFAVTAEENGENLGEAFGEGTRKACLKEHPTVAGAFETICLGIANTISGKSDEISAAGGDIVEGLKQGTEGEKGNLLSIFEELPDNMMSMMGDLLTAFKFPGRIIISGIGYGINNNKQRLYDQLSGMVPTMVSKLDGLYAAMWSVGQRAAQSLASGLQSVHIPTPNFSVGDRIATAAGTAFKVPNVAVSWMASGAVVPRNASRFIAGLGDNNHETEVVSPLSTMKQAVREVLAENGGAGGGTIRNIIQLNGRTVYDGIMDEAKARRDRTGRNPFDL